MNALIVKAAGLMGWVVEIDGLLDLDLQSPTWQGLIKRAQTAYPDRNVRVDADKFWMRRSRP